MTNHKLTQLNISVRDVSSAEKASNRTVGNLTTRPGKKLQYLTQRYGRALSGNTNHSVLIYMLQCLVKHALVWIPSFLQYSKPKPSSAWLLLQAIKTALQVRECRTGAAKRNNIHTMVAENENYIYYSFLSVGYTTTWQMGNKLCILSSVKECSRTWSNYNQTDATNNRTKSNTESPT